MNNLPQIKIGLIVGSTDWLPNIIAINKRQEVIKLYKEKFGEDSIYECPICVTDNEINIKRALKDVNKAECNALCMLFANYGPESAGTLLISEFDGPVMFLASAEESGEPFINDRNDGLSGFSNACYALKLRNTNVYIPSKPIVTAIGCVNAINKFISIARTYIAIKNLKVISFGPRPSSYLASFVDNSLLYNLGIELSEYSELELLNAYEKHVSDARIDDLAIDIKNELKATSDSDVYKKFAQYQLTVEDWIRNHKGDKKFVTLTSTCWPAFPVNFGFVPCYINSRLATKGYPVACEVDEYGAVTEYIGQAISDDVVTILNINNTVPEEIYNKKIKDKEFNGKKYKLSDLFIGYHCGVTSSCKLVDGGKEANHYANNLLIGEEKSKGTIQGQIQPGPVTLFRLQGSKENKLQAYICEGQILPVSIDTYGGYGVIAIPEMERFFRNIILDKHFPNHTGIIFGHYGSKIFDLLKYVGINNIYYNQNENEPYEKENVFDLHKEWY